MKHLASMLKRLVWVAAFVGLLWQVDKVEAANNSIIFVNLSSETIYLARYSYQPYAAARSSLPAGDYNLPAYQDEQPEGWWFEGWWHLNPGGSLTFSADTQSNFYVQNSQGRLTWSDLSTSQGYILRGQKFKGFASKAKWESDSQWLTNKGYTLVQFQKFSPGQYTIKGNAYRIVQQTFPFNISSRSPKYDSVMFNVPGNVIDYSYHADYWRAENVSWKWENDYTISVTAYVSGRQTSVGGARKPGYYRGTVTIYYTQRN